MTTFDRKAYPVQEEWVYTVEQAAWWCVDRSGQLNYLQNIVTSTALSVGIFQSNYPTHRVGLIHWETEARCQFPTASLVTCDSKRRIFVITSKEPSWVQVLHFCNCNVYHLLIGMQVRWFIAVQNYFLVGPCDGDPCNCIVCTYFLSAQPTNLSSDCLRWQKIITNHNQFV